MIIEPFRPRLKPILNTDANGFALSILARYHVDPMSFWTFEELTYLLSEHPEPQVLEKQIKEVVSVSPLVLNALKTTIKKETKKELMVQVVPSLMVYFKSHPEAVKQPMWLHQHQQIIHLLRQQSHVLGEVPNKRVLDVGDLLPIASKSELRQSGRRQSIQTLIKLIRSIENYYVDNNNPKATGRVAAINQREGANREQLVGLLGKMLAKEYGLRPTHLNRLDDEDQSDSREKGNRRPFRVSTNTVHSTRSSFNLSPSIKAVPIQNTGLSIHQLTSNIALAQANQPLEHISPFMLTETWLGGDPQKPERHIEKEAVKKESGQTAKERAKRQVLVEETLTELLKAILKGPKGSSGSHKGDASLRASMLLTPAVLAYWRGKAKSDKQPEDKPMGQVVMPQLVRRTLKEQLALEPLKKENALSTSRARNYKMKRTARGEKSSGRLGRKASPSAFESNYVPSLLINRVNQNLAQETLLTVINEQVNRTVNETIKKQLETTVHSEKRNNMVEVPVDLEWHSSKPSYDTSAASSSEWARIPNHVIDKLSNQVFQKVAEKLSLERRRRGL